MTLTEHRAQARQYLGNNIFDSRWMYTLLAGVIVSLLPSAVSAIPVVGVIASIIISGPLMVGMCIYLVHLARSTDKPQIGKIFDGCSEGFVENLLLGLMTAIFTFLWSLLFIIPGIVKSYAYSMAPYIRADHPEYTWRQCLDESIRITRGHKMRLFLLELSFIGWIIVGALCLGIGTLWVNAYMQAAKTSYYESICENVVTAKAEPAVDAQVAE